MKKLHALIAMASLTLIGTADAQTTDITVNTGIAQVGYTDPDNGQTVDPRSAVNALYSVNSGNVAGKEWDLYAFGYDSQNQTLTYAGGFNPAGTTDTATNGTTYTYHLGDIFFSSLNQQVTNPTYSDSQLGSSGNIPGTSAEYNNPGYSYAIHLGSVTNGNLSYSILALNSATQLLSTEFGVNQVSNPYAVDTSKGNFTDLYDGLLNIQNLSNSGVNKLLNESLFNPTGSGAIDNYALTFNVANLLADAGVNNPNLATQGFDISQTEQCGNDTIDGAFSGMSTVQAAPEPSSWLLALICAGSFVCLRRRALRA